MDSLPNASRERDRDYSDPTLATTSTTNQPSPPTQNQFTSSHNDQTTPLPTMTEVTTTTTPPATTTTTTMIDTPTTSTSITTTTLTPQQIQTLTNELFESCMNNDIPQMKSLLEQKANPNAFCNLYRHYQTEKELQHLNKEQMTPQPLSSDHVDPLYHNNPNNTLFHASILSNNIDMIKYVMNDLQINDIEETDLYGYNGLAIAVKKGYLNVVRYLINDCNIKTKVNIPTIHNCTWSLASLSFISGDFDTIEYIMELCKTSFYAGKASWDEIQPVLEYGFDSIIQLLVDKFKLSLYTISTYGSPIHSAINSNNIQLIDYLIITAGLNREQTRNGRTPLQYAINLESWDIVKHLLIKYKVSINTKAMNLLHQMVTIPTVPLYMIDFCINDMKIDPCSINSERHSALQCAIISKNYHIAQYLIETYDVYLPPISHDKPTGLLTLKSTSSTSQFVQLLHQQKQFRLYYRDDSYHIPIIHLTETAPLDVIKAIIEIGADVDKYTKTNCVDGVKRSQLLVNAVYNPDPHVLEYILDHVKEIEVTDSDKIGLLFETIKANDEKVAQLLIEKYNVNPLATLVQCESMNVLQYQFYTTSVNWKLVRYLIQLNCFDMNNPNFNPKNRCTILSWIFKEQGITPTFDDIQYCIDHGAPVELTVEPKDTFPPLIMAIKNHKCSIQLIDYFIQNGININNGAYDELQRELQPTTTTTLAIARYFIFNLGFDFNSTYKDYFPFLIDWFISRVSILVNDYNPSNLPEREVYQYTILLRFILYIIKIYNPIIHTRTFKLAVSRCNWGMIKLLIHHKVDLYAILLDHDSNGFDENKPTVLFNAIKAKDSSLLTIDQDQMNADMIELIINASFENDEYIDYVNNNQNYHDTIDDFFYRSEWYGYFKINHDEDHDDDNDDDEF